ncbi:unnamed protein product [Prunus brigantina]
MALCAMITVDAFMDFLEDIMTFLWGQAPKVGEAEATLVLGRAIANTPRFSRCLVLQKLKDGVHPCGAVIDGADEWCPCAGLIQDFHVDITAGALLYG